MAWAPHVLRAASATDRAQAAGPDAALVRRGACGRDPGPGLASGKGWPPALAGARRWLWLTSWELVDMACPACPRLCVPATGLEVGSAAEWGGP